MKSIETRRQFLGATVAALASACVHRTEDAASTIAADQEALRRIEQKTGGRLGVFVLDTQTGRRLAVRADERFAMCSTFKWLLAAQALLAVDRSQLELDRRVPYTSDDLLDHAPVAKEQLRRGYMKVEDLARAAVVVSDNTAANLLLDKLGGPQGLTQFARSLGDPTTRLDRSEPTLNGNEAGDVRDTTSPRAMVLLMNRILCGEVLSPASQQRLLGWLQASETGKARLRAGLPADWRVGDKTGTGEHGACNDIAIAKPPGRAPVLIAAYLSEGQVPLEQLEAAHAEIGRIVSARG